MTLGLVRAAARVGVPTAGVRMAAATARVSASRHLRMTATARTRVTAAAGVRMTATTSIRVTAADVTARVWGSSAGVAVRCAATGAARVTLMAVIARYRGMSAARGAVILTARATMTCGARTAVILRAMSGRATVMRYLVADRTTMRATSVRADNTSSRKLARSCRRGYPGPSVVE
jgi:hypothetical protein